MVNNRGFLTHKVNHKKGRKNDYDIYKNNLPMTPKQVVNVLDLGYLGVEKDFPEQLSDYHIKGKEIHKSYLQRKKNTTKFILKRG